MNKQYKYKFSVIMPIYNVEPYLREAIDTIVRQSIGFEENIQLILVNDGSTDGSRHICSEYKDKYPGNVIYVEQENQGVSKARNSGMRYVEGRYVNFFDSDDKWGLDAFYKAWTYLEEHADEIDLVCCKEFFFEGQTGEPILNNKFKKGDRIIDINEEPTCIHVSIKSSFIKGNVVKQEQFDTRISVGEDVKYLTHIILKRGRYGVLQSAAYYFRKRYANTSITQNPKPGRYIETVEHYYKYLLDYSEREYGKLLPYIQHTVLHGLKYRILEKRVEFLSYEQWQQYTENIISLIRRIDDEIIASTGNIKVSTKIHLLKLKYGDKAKREIYINNGYVCFRGISLAKVPNNSVVIDEMTVSWRKINISGIVKITMNENIGLFVEENGKYCRVETIKDDKLSREDFAGNKIIIGRRFDVTMSKKNVNMSFYLGREGDLFKITPKN